ncbi:MAG: exodeoxyribonuclease VII large subunit [Candidatus Paceibacterota bacterium]|jgi:exodeoxyribonuclease VII large subunit
MELDENNPAQPLFTVSEFLDAVNYVLKHDKALVRGEVTDFKKGKWISFSLKDKDDNSLLKCVMGAWLYNQIGVQIEDGMEIKISGSPSINKAYGSFGFWVETIEPLGEGSLKKAYELLVKKLREEGLFTRKRELPEFIERIGVISSKHGVVIHDFKQNLDKRGYKIIFKDARVEGADAVGQIVEAIHELQNKKYNLDILVIIRGGGSLESMQAFNNEAVARAIFASNIPIIAGIGHDVDVPIASLVADREESTPTGAAHAVNESWNRLESLLPIYERNTLAYLDMSRIKESVTGLGKVISAQFSQMLEDAQTELKRCAQLVTLLDPARNLRLGYSIVRSGGKVLKSVKQAKLGAELNIELGDGEIISKVIKI